MPEQARSRFQRNNCRTRHQNPCRSPSRSGLGRSSDRPRRGVLAQHEAGLNQEDALVVAWDRSSPSGFDRFDRNAACGGSMLILCCCWVVRTATTSSLRTQPNAMSMVRARVG